MKTTRSSRGSQSLLGFRQIRNTLAVWRSMASQGRRCVVLALDGLERPSYKTLPQSAKALPKLQFRATDCNSVSRLATSLVWAAETASGHPCIPVLQTVGGASAIPSVASVPEPWISRYEAIMILTLFA